MSADTHTHTHQLMSYELVYTSIHSSIIYIYTLQIDDTRMRYKGIGDKKFASVIRDTKSSRALLYFVSVTLVV